jgi:mannose-6-phosphate isomerase class I
MAANLHAVFKKCCKEVQACSEIVIHTHDNVLGRLNGVFAECKLFVEQDSV